MEYKRHIPSPLGQILLTGNSMGITGVQFVDDQDCPNYIHTPEAVKAIFSQAEKWIRAYFAGEKPAELPSLQLHCTPFQQEVYKILLSIPYGTTVTYGQIAKMIAVSKGKRMSAQAVGGAVRKNPISLMIPCHRVIGSNGSLTGYSGGLHRKKKLLELENSGR